MKIPLSRPAQPPTGLTEASFAVVQTQWARLLLGALVQAGARHAVISPGSRSTPLVAAALRTPGLVLHPVIDERCAAFFGLGLARASRLPTLLICTSGTAPAHYFPAVIEARHAGIPLIVLSADRPLEQVWVGAAQTIDQTRLFGEFAVASWDLGIPEADLLCLRTLVRRAHDAVTLALTKGGTVQLNVRARKPLEPVVSVTPAEQTLEALVTELLNAPAPRVHRPLAPAIPDWPALTSIHAGRTVVVIGPVLPAHVQDVLPALVARLAACGLPVLAETTSQLPLSGLRGASGLMAPFEHLIRVPELREALRPEVILQLGATPTSAALEHWFQELAAPAGGGRPAPGAVIGSGLRPTRRILLSDGLETDPVSSGERWLIPEGTSFLAAVEAVLRQCAPEALPEPLRDEARWYARAWAEVHRAQTRALQRLLVLPEQVSPVPWTGPTALQEVLRIWKYAHPEADLLLGNSLLLREVELYSFPIEGAQEASPARRVYFQRGVNGIDGLISQACGIAQASERPILALLGDVTACHDLGGLALAQNVRHPVVILVMDNGGGRIFDLLPVADAATLSAEDRRWWSTPSAVDRVALAQGCGARAFYIDDEVTLLTQLSHALVRRGVTLLELKVEGSQVRSFSQTVRVATRTAILGALEALPEPPVRGPSDQDECCEVG